MLDRSRSLQIYMKPGIKEDALMLRVWEACRKHDRPQDVFRSMLRAGLMAMMESGEMPESVIEECGLEAMFERRRRRTRRMAETAQQVPLAPAYPPYAYPQHPVQAQPLPPVQQPPAAWTPAETQRTFSPPPAQEDRPAAPEKRPEPARTETPAEPRPEEKPEPPVARETAAGQDSPKSRIGKLM